MTQFNFGNSNSGEYEIDRSKSINGTASADAIPTEKGTQIEDHSHAIIEDREMLAGKIESTTEAGGPIIGESGDAIAHSKIEQPSGGIIPGSSIASTIEGTTPSIREGGITEKLPSYADFKKYRIARAAGKIDLAAPYTAASTPHPPRNQLAANVDNSGGSEDSIDNRSIPISGIINEPIERK